MTKSSFSPVISLGLLAVSFILCLQGTLGAEGTTILRNPEHPLYRGYFKISGRKTHLIGSLKDKSPWDHMDNEGKRVRHVEGSIEIEVNEKDNTGYVIAEAQTDEGTLKIIFDRFEEWQSYQDGGIASRIYEHGDSGNGDTMYPKTWLYLGGWGRANVYLNGKLLYKDYQAHFMVMEGARDDTTHEVKYPSEKKAPGGDVDPADMEIDLYVRSEELNNGNNPPREVFLHLFWEEVIWP